MSKSAIIQKYQQHPKIGQIAELFASRKKINATGLVGSSLSFVMDALFKKSELPFLLLFNDKEEAAYYLNDLEALINNQDELFYPGSYRRPYQIEETDNANVLLRAEVLNRINSQKKPAIIVSYTDAIFEKVVTRKELDKNTLKLSVNDKLSIDFINETLFEYHFKRVDFVSDPGEFSVRGGIIDVFSFSNDVPYRIEFFGDEVDSIRTFDPSTQLSEKTHQYFFIVPNIQGSLIQQGVSSFFEFIGKDAVVWLTDLEQIEDSLKKEYDKALGIFNSLESTVKFAIPSDLYLHPSAALCEISELRIIEWGAKKNYDPTIIVDFDFIPQPSFNKNFDLLSTDLLELTNLGNTNLIFSNQPKQIERLHQIFQDINQDVQFVSMNSSLHEGFIAPSLKLVCYTDHQIFERYHRFRLKEGFQQAKQALTLKEIYNLQKGDYVTHIDHGIGQFSGLDEFALSFRKEVWNSFASSDFKIYR